MKIPQYLRAAVALLGVSTKEFTVGWANGMVRHQMRNDHLDGTGQVIGIVRNPFTPGTVKYAASEAAVAFLRSMGR